LLLNRTVGWVSYLDPTEANTTHRVLGEGKIKFSTYLNSIATEAKLILLGFTPFNPTYLNHDLN